MADEAKRMMELGFQGYSCAQILLLLALDAQERSNPDLVRAMSVAICIFSSPGDENLRSPRRRFQKRTSSGPSV